jgi:signal transduction histidine kinase
MKVLISVSLSAEICNPFFTTKPTGQGTGLGLSIARTLTHAMGGTLRVQSATGEGSRFTLELPRWDAPTQPPG